MSLWNDVLNQQVWEWYCGDIDSCLVIRMDLNARNDKSPFKGGMNFTVALVTLSVIDLMAGYYSGKEPNKKDVALFLQRYYGKHYSLFNDLEFSEKFYEVYRNGLVHSWSPKFAGISMDFSDY